jgi:hypothetical protein
MMKIFLKDILDATIKEIVRLYEYSKEEAE